MRTRSGFLPRRAKHNIANLGLAAAEGRYGAFIEQRRRTTVVSPEVQLSAGPRQPIAGLTIRAMLDRLGRGADHAAWSMLLPLETGRTTMKIGFNLLLWTGHVDDSHLPHIEALKAAGYDGVEIPMFGGDTAHYQRLGRQIRDMGLEVTAITLIPDAERNPLSDNPAHRRAAVDWLSGAAEWAAALGSPILCGPIHQPLGLFTGAPPTDLEKGRLAEVHRATAENAAKLGIPVAVEYLNRFEAYILNTMADALAHAKRVDHPNFGVMHDTFHANLEEKDPVGIIYQAAPMLRHVHISENDRGTPGRGHIAFGPHFKALRAVGYDGWLTIEAFGRALPSLAAATRVWRDFFPTPDQVYLEGIKLIREGWAAAG